MRRIQIGSLCALGSEHLTPLSLKTLLEARHTSSADAAHLTKLYRTTNCCEVRGLLAAEQVSGILETLQPSHVGAKTLGVCVVFAACMAEVCVLDFGVRRITADFRRSMCWRTANKQTLTHSDLDSPEIGLRGTGVTSKQTFTHVPRTKSCNEDPGQVL